MSAIVRCRGVEKIYQAGRDRGAGAARRRSRHRGRRFRHAGGSLGLGQDDASQHHRRARPADEQVKSSLTASRWAARQEQPRRHAAAQDRLRVPDLQPDPGAVGGGECRIHSRTAERAAQGKRDTRAVEVLAKWALKAWKTAGRRGFPADSSSALRWRGRWGRSPRSCSPTSRPPIWTPRIAEELIALMAHLNATSGITFLIATHDPRVIAHSRSHIEMTDGRITADETCKAADELHAFAARTTQGVRGRLARACFLSVRGMRRHDDAIHGRLELQDAVSFIRPQRQPRCGARHRGPQRSVWQFRLTWDPSWGSLEFRFPLRSRRTRRRQTCVLRATKRGLLPARLRPGSTSPTPSSTTANDRASRASTGFRSAYTTPDFVVRVGRQALTWGSGFRVPADGSLRSIFAGRDGHRIQARHRHALHAMSLRRRIGSAIHRRAAFARAERRGPDFECKLLRAALSRHDRGLTKRRGCSRAITATGRARSA